MFRADGHLAPIVDGLASLPSSAFGGEGAVTRKGEPGWLRLKGIVARLDDEIRRRRKANARNLGAENLDDRMLRDIGLVRDRLAAIVRRGEAAEG